MTTLTDRLADPAALAAAWDRIWERDDEDGLRSGSVLRFAENYEENLERIAAALVDRSYRIGRLTPVDIPKDDGGVRTLLIGSARDRVVERTLASLITPLTDPHFEHSSFGYRPGLGVGDAVRRLAHLRDSGLGWVLRTAIDDCFESIDAQRAVETIRPWVPDPYLVDLIWDFVGPGRRPNGHWGGLPQGGPLSPLLSNVVLNQVDRGLLLQGFQIVRYADDIAVPTATRSEAQEAKEVLSLETNRLGLRLGEEDTQIVDFVTGFAFLGEEFGSRYPPALKPAVAEVRRKTLYVGHQGSYIAIRRGRIVVLRRKKELLSVPASHVGRIVTGGSVGLSPGARAWALANGVDAVSLSRRGSYLGGLVGPKSSAILRRRRQLAATARDEVRLAKGRRMAEAKLRNQRSLLLRFNRRQKSEEAARATVEIEKMADMMADAEAIDETDGLEGFGARLYFEAFGALLPDGVTWNGRNRRPPLDAANAALSYGYAILAGEAGTAVAIAGLDPTAGFLHSDHHNRPSLTLDLIEEFRPVVVDSVVLELFRREVLTDAGTRTEKGRGGVLLTTAARNSLIAGIEERLLTQHKYLYSDRKATWRRQIQLQAIQIAKCVDRDEFDYEPVRWR